MALKYTNKAIGHSPMAYHVNIESPFDARLVVNNYSDLLEWDVANDKPYKGMVVAVVEDEDPTKNGLYMLINKTGNGSVLEESDWQKVASQGEGVEYSFKKATDTKNVDFKVGVGENGVYNVSADVDVFDCGEYGDLEYVEYAKYDYTDDGYVNQLDLDELTNSELPGYERVDGKDYDITVEELHQLIMDIAGNTETGIPV